MSVMTLKLDKIVVGEQARKHFDPEDLRCLGENIKEIGLLNPLLVKPRGDLFDLVAGERRLRAMRMVGITEALAMLLDEMDAGDTELIQFIENHQRSDLLPTEKARALLDLKTKKGWNNKQLAERLKMRDASLAGKYLSLFDTIPAVQQAAEAGKIGVSMWNRISTLPPCDQPGVLELYLSGMSREQCDELSRKQRNARPAGDKPEQAVSKGKFLLPKAVVQVSGDGLTLAGMIDVLSELVKEAKAGQSQGMDVKAFMALLTARSKDKSKK